jgi:signal transduction histidine kinase
MVDFNSAMDSDDNPVSSEREQTDESLRVEREKADEVLDDEGSAVDDTADAVISRARARADEVLAAARAKTDRQSAPPAAGALPAETIKRERAREDELLQEERQNADEVLREERAEHVALLSREREETDKDLSNERTRADEALATRDEFLGIVSHDLRTMLNAVMGYAGLIARAESQENHREQVVKYAQRIQRSGTRMNRMIGDLVDLACIEAGVLAVTRENGDPTQVVTEAVDTFQPQASASGVALAVEIVPPASLAAFDSARILQVLSNLLSNAIKFTPANGRVTVRLERVEDEMRFAISDTGVGIPSDQLEAVFVRFVQVTNDRRGVGLGLYISKAIVQGHGGRIWAESTIGRGSTFFFTLPVHTAS